MVRRTTIALLLVSGNSRVPVICLGREPVGGGIASAVGREPTASKA
jgi:hypothetical protein